MTKLCIKCNKIKNQEDDFPYRKDSNKYHNICKQCKREVSSHYRIANPDKNKEWKLNNSDKTKIHNNNYYKKNKEKLLARNFKYRENNREKMLNYHKEYYKTHKANINAYVEANRERIKLRVKKYGQTRRANVSEEGKIKRRLYSKEYYKKLMLSVKYRIDKSMSVQIRQSLRGNKNGRIWESLVGYSLKELMDYLESLFNTKMNWSNYGFYWEIDHIIPKSLFNYNNYEAEEFKECWALSNLQPLNKQTNREKGNRIKHLQIREYPFKK